MRIPGSGTSVWMQLQASGLMSDKFNKHCVNVLIWLDLFGFFVMPLDVIVTLSITY